MTGPFWHSFEAPSGSKPDNIADDRPNRRPDDERHQTGLAVVRHETKHEQQHDQSNDDRHPFTLLFSSIVELLNPSRIVQLLVVAFGEWQKE